MLKKAICTLILVVAPLSAFAATVHVGDYFLKGKDTAPDDVYAVGDQVTLAGKVEGDVIAIAGKVFSDSDITGDVLFIGEEVTVEGVVKDDVRTVGGTVTINGLVKDDVVAIGSKVFVSDTARIEGSLYIIGGEAEVHGTILGEAKVLSSKFLLTGVVEKDLEMWGKASFAQPARIGGDFIYHAKGKASAPVNVGIAGKVILDETKGARMHAPRALIGGLYSLKVLMMLALGFLLFFLARERSEEVLLEILPNFWMRVLRGLLIMLVLPMLIVLLIPTVIGIPIALCLAMLFIVLLLLSWAYSGILLGAWCERIFFKRSAFPLSYRPVLLGIILLSVISLIPVIGPLFYAALLLSAVGALGTLFFNFIRSR